MMTPGRSGPVAVVASLLVALSASPAAAQYVPEGEVLTTGEAVTINVPDADRLLITYRPGSNISETDTIAVEGMSYAWTPRSPGIVSISTPGGTTQTVSVRFDGIAASGLVILVVASGILFGGALFSAIKLFGETSPEMLTDRPDT